MATSVCDVRPCDLFLRARREGLVVSHHKGKYDFLVARWPKQGRIPKRFAWVTLLYCPFCGTRIDEEWPRSWPHEEFLMAGRMR